MNNTTEKAVTDAGTLPRVQFGKIRLQNDNVLINTAPEKYELANKVVAERDAAFACIRRLMLVENATGQTILAMEEAALVLNGARGEVL